MVCWWILSSRKRTYKKDGPIEKKSGGSEELFRSDGHLNPAQPGLQPELVTVSETHFVKPPDRLDLSHSAVYVDLDTGDVRLILGGQKRHGPGHFLGLSKPLHRDLRNDFPGELIDGFFW